MNTTPRRWQEILFNRKMVTCIFLGFTSGMPLYVLIQLVPAWLRSHEVDLATIGLFALVSLPYTWKFLWSPLMDRFRPPFLGRRRGWALVTQIALFVVIGALGHVDPAASLQAAVALQRPVCLMHMLGQPRTMQQQPEYGDVVAEVRDFLAQRVRECVAAGLAEDSIVVDPGFGFGKTPRHNVELLSNLRQLRSTGRPVLVGLSRKSTLGALTGRDVEDRMPASIAAAVIAVIEGAAIVRVHDVRETVDALRVAAAVMQRDGD